MNLKYDSVIEMEKYKSLLRIKSSNFLSFPMNQPEEEYCLL